MSSSGTPNSCKTSISWRGLGGPQEWQSIETSLSESLKFTLCYLPKKKKTAKARNCCYVEMKPDNRRLLLLADKSIRRLNDSKLRPKKSVLEWQRDRESKESSKHLVRWFDALSIHGNFKIAVLWGIFKPRLWQISWYSLTTSLHRNMWSHVKHTSSSFSFPFRSVKNQNCHPPPSSSYNVTRKVLSSLI